MPSIGGSPVDGRCARSEALPEVLQEKKRQRKEGQMGERNLQNESQKRI